MHIKFCDWYWYFWTVSHLIPLPVLLFLRLIVCACTLWLIELAYAHIIYQLMKNKSLSLVKDDRFLPSLMLKTITHTCTNAFRILNPFCLFPIIGIIRTGNWSANIHNIRQRQFYLFMYFRNFAHSWIPELA